MLRPQLYMPGGFLIASAANPPRPLREIPVDMLHPFAVLQSSAPLRETPAGALNGSCQIRPVKTGCLLLRFLCFLWPTSEYVTPPCPRLPTGMFSSITCALS